MSGISHCGTSGKGRWLVADSSSVLWTEHTPRVFFGWWVVAASALGLVVSYGPIVLATFGVFLGPLHREFGWSRSELSGAVSVATLLVAFFQPMCGRLVDRWGTRRVVVLSLALFGSTLLALSALRSLWHFYLGYMLLGLFGTGTTPVSYSRLVSRWFEHKRGRALGLSLAGFGVGMLVMPVFVHAVIVRWGWRWAYGVLGALIIAGVIPVLGVLLRESPEQMGLLPDGRRRAAARDPVGEFSSRTHRQREPDGRSWSEARRSLTFWKIAMAFFLVSTSVHACLIHFVPLLTDRGFSPERAVKAASLFGIAILVGRLTVGYLLDRLFAPSVVAALFGGVLLGLVCLWLGAPAGFPFLAAFLLGLGLGMDTLAYLMTQYFGLRAFGEIYGYAFAGVIGGGSVGPFFLSVIFHRTGSYEPGLVVLILLVGIAVGLIGSLRPSEARISAR